MVKVNSLINHLNSCKQYYNEFPDIFDNCVREYKNKTVLAQTKLHSFMDSNEFVLALPIMA